MKQFIGGVILGTLLTAAAAGLAGSPDPLGIGRSEQQRRFDYYRERGAQLDIKALRERADRERVERQLGRPCRD